MSDEDDRAGDPKTLTLDSMNVHDGKIVLNFYKNDMEVRGDFFPAQFDGKAITQNYIRRVLDEHKVIYGVKQEEIHQALERCTNENTLVTDVLMAEGSQPEVEIPEHMHLNPQLNHADDQIQKKGSVDHRNRSPYVIVKKGQALAVHRPKKPGLDGINVHGEVVKFDVIRPNGVQGGDNTQMEGKFLVSSIDGQLIQTKGVLNVRESLVVKGPVGYRTGNIVFPGDVEIEGPVSDGFKIYSGGSITIKQTFDVTNSSAKKDLNVAGGIIGRGQAMVKVGGVLRTRFIENCRVACRKKVLVELEIINSKIYTMETLEMGEKGRIIGGEIYAVQGLIAGSLGRKTGRAARIHCGVDFAQEQEREKNNSLLKLLSSRINRLRLLMEEPDSQGEKRLNQEASLKKLELEQDRVQAKISDLLGNANNYEDATVEVRGEIAPGTLIEICHTALYVTEVLKKVRIRLDKVNNKLITESL